MWVLWVEIVAAVLTISFAAALQVGRALRAAGRADEYCEDVCSGTGNCTCANRVVMGDIGGLPYNPE
jgi:hypothetical protein